MKKHGRFMVGLVGVAAVVTYLVWTGVSETMVYYLTPAELMAKVADDPTFTVEYGNALPDTFTEDVEVVLEGRMDAEGTFHATTLLTKCGSRYEAAPEDLAG